MSDLISRQAVNDVLFDYSSLRAVDYARIMEHIDKLPSVENKGEWIPVSERLPERCKEVIVTDVETSDTYQSRYIGNGYWECDNGTFKNRIIAWMPLPKPYKTESEG